MRIRPVTRGKGVKAGDALYCAAYRGGRELWNERTGELYRYDWREDVLDSGIVLPSEFDKDPAMRWARDPYKLWNTAEFTESQHNSRVARDYMMILPHEMTQQQRREVVFGFAQILANRYGNAIDVALHDRRTGRARYCHAHLLATTRKVGRLGLLEKTDAEISGWARTSRGLSHSCQQEYEQIRGLWEQTLQSAVHQAGLPGQVYASLNKEYGKGETTAEYHRRLLREGFDLHGQQREDACKAVLTREERRESADKKWAIRKFIQLQREARADRRREVVRNRKAGRLLQGQGRYQRTWLPRWDVTRGLLNPWEVERQIRHVGQTQAMVPWVAKVNPGAEPEFELQPEAGPKPRYERTLVKPRALMSSAPRGQLAQNSIQRWLSQRNSQPEKDAGMKLRESVQRWMRMRRETERGEISERYPPRSREGRALSR